MQSVTTDIEQRYIVFKLTDLEKYLLPGQLNMILETGYDIALNRESEGKEPIDGLFIDKRWTIYPKVLSLLEEMINGK